MTISDFSAVRCPLTAYSNHIQPNDLPRYEFIFNNTSKSDTPIKVYVLMNRLNDGSDQAKAHAYLTGASTELSTDYFKGYTETTADINGIETSVLYREKTENTTERAVFAHDKYLVYVTASEGIDVFEFMSKLTFEKHTVVRDLTGPHGGYPSTEKPAYIGAQTGAAFSASSEFAEFIETVDISQNYDNKFRCFDSFVNQITDMGYFMDVCYTNNSEYDLKISAFTGVDINDIPANDEPCYEYCLLDSASMLLRTYPQITFSFIDESHAMYEYLTGSTTQLPASLDGYESAVLKIDGVDCPALSLTKDQLNWDHRYYYFMQGDYLVCVDQTAKNLNFADIDETVSNLTFNKVEIKRTLEK
ncbi:MAG: hypothetical protein IJO48_03155 [Clostridia bacterium]|nr:hypothetical protein [Clostridia bacterium]